MKLLSPSFQRSWTSSRAFTMVEIALSIAVVAFAMVAILGVLPTGLQVQRDNRDETVINNDGAYLMEAIRTGNDRLGRLSNSVYLVQINYNNGDREIIRNDAYPKIDGQRLIGLLSRPVDPIRRRGVSNVVAWVRAINGTMMNQDESLSDFSFRYQLVSEIRPFVGHPPADTNTLGTNELARLNRLQSSLYEVRLLTRWPLYRDNVEAPENARVGSHRRTFRSLVAGSQFNYETNFASGQFRLYFFRPSIYGL